MLDGMRQAFVRLGEQYNHLDQVAQNQANISTPGFRGADGGVRQGQFAQWLKNQHGQISHTGRASDVVLAPDAYLQVRTADDVTRYTRRGDLRVDEQRRLVTGGGDPVLDDAGSPIVLPPGALHINTDGTVMSGSKAVAKLGRFKMDQVQELTGTLFTPAGTEPTPDTQPLAVGELESSNVDVAVEQTRLIAINNRTRIYSQVIQTLDGTLDKAIQQLGNGHA